MPDPITISTILGSVQHGFNIIKAIRDADVSYASSELKMQVAELYGTLAEVKHSAVDLQETIRDKDKEIERLTQALEQKGELLKLSDSYYFKGKDGQPIGEPYCLNCWESNHLLRHLIRLTRVWTCPNCKTDYDTFRVPGNKGG